MKLNLSQVLTHIDGKTPHAAYPTVRVALMFALENAPPPPPPPPQPGKPPRPPDLRSLKRARGALLDLARSKDILSLTPADVDLLERLSASVFSPNVYHQLWKALGSPE